MKTCLIYGPDIYEVYEGGIFTLRLNHGFEYHIRIISLEMVSRWLTRHTDLKLYIFIFFT
jgi:hypothetical protein